MNSNGRMLLQIPIVHTDADMGRLAEPFGQAAAARLGVSAWQRHLTEVQRLWDATEQAVLGLGLDYGALSLYQDGLPVCDREDALVDELAATGSRNHLLLQRLRGLGATLVGSESPELLVEEYALARQVLEAGPSTATQTDARRALAADLLERRDRFIAQRIAATLAPGGTGLLFIGALHDVAPWLPADIGVNYPIGRPRQSARP